MNFKSDKKKLYENIAKIIEGNFSEPDLQYIKIKKGKIKIYFETELLHTYASFEYAGYDECVYYKLKDKNHAVDEVSSEIFTKILTYLNKYIKGETDEAI